MLGHRPLNADDYLAILKHRWWLFALPAILLSAAGIAATLYISPQYVSRTSVLIDQQKVPDELVKPVVSEDINSRLASMNEQILSRSSIQPMVEKYGLYATQHLSMDDRVDLARKNIDIKALPTGFARANGAPGFEISFTANDAHTAQMVCAEITSLFTAANLRSREAAAEGTTDFLKEQLNNAKAVLDDQDAKLAAFQQHNFGTLPEDQANNVNILSTLNTQLEAATQALSRMEQDKSYMEAMLAQQQQAAPVSGSTAAAVQSAQERQLQELLAQQADLSMHYTADYPDVVAINRKIADLRKKIAAQPAPAPVTTLIAPSKNDSPSVQDLRARIHAADLGILAKRAEQAQLSQQVRQYQGRIQSSPQIEEQFKELTRDAQTSQAQYDSLLSKLNQSQMATDLEHRQEGETFRVLDEANLPDGPTYPKRSVFAMGGFGSGLGLGLLIVALLEYMDTALRTDRDIWAFTKLPTLAVIAWSGDVASLKLSKRSRLKRFFSRKPPTSATPTPLADAPR
jgi:polysaccharide chain length determinant protein (PEP-CTERM system associated)